MGVGAYPRWRANEPPIFSATGWNAAMRAAEAHDQDLLSQTVSRLAATTSHNIILVKNTSGAVRDPLHILGLGDWTVTPGTDFEALAEHLCLDGATPATTTHKYKWAVLLDGLGENEVGRAVLGGLVLVKVNIVHAADERCTITNSDATKLTSGAWGRGRIFKAESGTGDKWALVELGPAADVIVYGKPTASKSEGATDATLNLWDPAFAGALGPSVSNVIIRVRNVTADTRMTANIVGGVANAFPIDCVDP